MRLRVCFSCVAFPYVRVVSCSLPLGLRRPLRCPVELTQLPIFFRICASVLLEVQSCNDVVVCCGLNSAAVVALADSEACHFPVRVKGFSLVFLSLYLFSVLAVFLVCFGGLFNLFDGRSILFCVLCPGICLFCVGEVLRF